MATRLVSVNGMLLAIFRPALVGAVIGTRLPEVLPAKFVLARRAGGGSVDPRFLDRAIVDVQTFAATSKTSEDLSIDARQALLEVWETQAVFEGGSISHFADMSAPSELDDSSIPKNVYRYQASYELGVRPA